MAAFQFPDPASQTTVTNTITGSTYQWKEPPGKWVLASQPQLEVSDIIWEGDNPPDPVGDYKLWYSTETLELYYYYCDADGVCTWESTSGADIFYGDNPPTADDGEYKFWFDTTRTDLCILYADMWFPVSVSSGNGGGSGGGGGASFPEAPSDGKQYARKDKSWDEVVEFIPEDYVNLTEIQTIENQKIFKMDDYFHRTPIVCQAADNLTESQGGMSAFMVKDSTGEAILSVRNDGKTRTRLGLEFTDSRDLVNKGYVDSVAKTGYADTLGRLFTWSTEEDVINNTKGAFAITDDSLLYSYVDEEGVKMRMRCQRFLANPNPKLDIKSLVTLYVVDTTDMWEMVTFGVWDGTTECHDTGYQILPGITWSNPIRYPGPKLGDQFRITVAGLF